MSNLHDVGGVAHVQRSRSISPEPLPLDTEFTRYFDALGLDPNDNCEDTSGTNEETKTAPLFSWLVKVSETNCSSNGQPASPLTFEQYAVLGQRVDETVNQQESCDSEEAVDAKHAQLIFQNTNSPWSAFICGSQGSGKSYTLSCMLENCLLPSDKIGRLSKPLTGLVFHYDTHSMGSPCEAAYLCSAGVPVRVFVSPSNYLTMQKAYSKFGSAKGTVAVLPLVFQDRHLNIERMLKLMAFSDKEEGVPLYIEVINRILRRMATATQRTSGFDYAEFKRQLDQGDFARNQIGPMRLRLDLLESFLDPQVVKSAPYKTKFGKKESGKPAEIFDFEPGSLTIVDLTDPFIEAASACVLFEICLGLCFESDACKDGRVVALDEAHKVGNDKHGQQLPWGLSLTKLQFMDKSVAAQNFTNSLLTAIREQRHTAARIIIATQEPTISPKLLDLCSLTLVHRFTSPQWLEALKAHLAGASAIAGGGQSNLERIFKTIVSLNVGESLLFSPSALLEIANGGPQKLGTGYVKLKTRRRLGQDGGRSILAVRNDN